MVQAETQLQLQRLNYKGFIPDLSRPPFLGLKLHISGSSCKGYILDLFKGWFLRFPPHKGFPNCLCIRLNFILYPYFNAFPKRCTSKRFPPWKPLINTKNHFTSPFLRQHRAYHNYTHHIYILHIK